ncbi:CNOT6L [Cordylochernes scorpioides]|uniref:CNOT6L n=1 Tax=Cordylochernes scorpioides TaxID=51811 RepID=A0ABY6L890_9ARAC|nr:CNOT6L [Cordylochernes scorpioides]
MFEMVEENPNWKEKVITGDETLVYGYDQETKRQSMEWKGKDEPRNPDFASQKKKVLLVTFFGIKGIVHYEYLEEGQTINNESYLNIMRRDAELQALLDEDSTQMQEKLAKQLQVSQGAVSLRLNSLGMTQKLSRWVPHEHEKKSFLHRIVTSDEKWIHFSNPTRQRSWGLPGQFPKQTPRPKRFGKRQCFAYGGTRPA